MARLSDLFVSIRASDDQARKVLTGFQKQLDDTDRKKVSPKITLPSQVQADVAGLQSKLVALGRTQVKLNVDSATVKADVATLEKQIAALKARKITLPTDLQDTAERELRDLETQLVKAQRRQTQIPLKLERIGAQVAAVEGELNKAGSEFAKAGADSGKKFGGSFGGAAKSLIGAAVAYVGVSELVGFFKDANAEAREAQKVGAATTAIIKATGGAAKISADQVGQLATAISNKSGVDDEAVQSGANLLLTFRNVRNEAGKGSDVFDRATQAAVDLSAAGFGSINSASKQLGKALQDPVRGIAALNRAGVTFTEQQKEQIKTLVQSGDVLGAQKVILGEVERQVGGVAAASATAGEKFTVAFDNLKEQLGTALLPTIDAVATTLTSKVIPAVSSFLTEMQTGVGTGGKFAAFLTSAKEAGQNFYQALKLIAPAAKTVGSALGALLGSSQSVTTALSAVVAILAARKIAGFAQSLSGVAARLTEIGGAAGGVGGKLGTVSKGLGSVAGVLGGPWGIAIGLGVTALVSFATQQKQAAKEAKAFTDTLTFQNGALDDNSRATLASKLAKEGTLSAAVKAGVAEKDYTEALLNGGAARQQMIDKLNAIVAANTTYVSAGQGTIKSLSLEGEAAQKAAKELETQGSALDASAVSAKQATNALGQTNKATDVATGSASRLTTGQEALQQATDQLKGAQVKLKTATQQMIDKFTILRTGTLDADRASDAFKESLDDVTQSVKDNGRSLDSNSEKGRANREAIRNAISALNDKITSDVKATGTTKGLSEKLVKGESDLRKQAAAAGFSKQETDKLINSYLKTPKEIETEVKTPGMKDAKSNVDTLKQKIKDMRNKGITVSTKIKFDPDKLASSLIKGDYFNNPGAFQGRAMGGPIQNLSGRGRRGVDTEPVLAAIDEHMMTSKEVAKLGGHAQVYGMRKAIMQGDLAEWAMANGYNNGGAIRRQIMAQFNIDRIPTVAISKLPSRTARASGEAGTKYAEDVAEKWLKAAQKKYKAAGGALPNIDVSNPRGRTSYRGGIFTNLFAANLRRAEKLAGATLSVFQGGFRPATSYSGTSHQGDAVDTAVNYSILRALRRVGIAAGDRTGLGNWAPHVHAVPTPGAGYAAGSAVWQAQDYLRRGGANQSPTSPWGLENGAVVKGGRGGVAAAIGEGSYDELVTPVPRSWKPGATDEKLDELIALLRDARERNITVPLEVNITNQGKDQKINTVLQRVADFGLV